jgi:hypothetical protein
MKNLSLVLQKLEETPHLFIVLKEEVNKLISEIKNCKDLHEVHVYFDILQNIHGVLSDLFFVEGLLIPDIFLKFMRDYERLDDNNIRKYLFDEIKNTNYNL